MTPVRDGSSPEKAVILEGRRREHVTKVWDWIAAHHPACSLSSYKQALIFHGTGCVDSITIIGSRGRRKTVYFHISRCEIRRIVRGRAAPNGGLDLFGRRTLLERRALRIRFDGSLPGSPAGFHRGRELGASFWRDIGLSLNRLSSTWTFGGRRFCLLCDWLRRLDSPACDRVSGRLLLSLPRLCRRHRVKFTLQPGKLLGTRPQASLESANLLLKIFQFHNAAKALLHIQAANYTQKRARRAIAYWKDRLQERIIVTIM